LYAEFPETIWKQIEFQYLKSQLKHSSATHFSKSFDPLLKGILKVGSEIEYGFFKGIINYTNKLNFDFGQMNGKELFLIKLVFDIIKFILNYNPEVLTTMKAPEFPILMQFMEHWLKNLAVLIYS
jgi:hypothetical protein